LRSRLAGGGTDITARIIAPKLSEQLGQQVVVENRAGAGTMIGGEVVARAAPDGYTLLMGISTLAINPSMYRKVPYDALKDFVPISQVVSLSNLLVTHPSLPVQSVKTLIAFAKPRPGEIYYASAGVGTNPHLSVELFLSMAGLRMVHVPYKGSGQGIVDRSRRARAGDDAEHPHGVAARENRPPARARRHRREARGRCAGDPDDRRGGRAGLRGGAMVWRARPGRHAARDRRTRPR